MTMYMPNIIYRPTIIHYTCIQTYVVLSTAAQPRMLKGRRKAIWVADEARQAMAVDQSFSMTCTCVLTVSVSRVCKLNLNRYYMGLRSLFLALISSRSPCRENPSEKFVANIIVARLILFCHICCVSPYIIKQCFPTFLANCAIIHEAR